ncbi:STAS domain-containing protein [Aliamphritea hakodatensis]|uniref:STAS domain-containing protein n=1 Tax=Aliamphritea hakodatensis TaxID=2895352 RepID=UPI0022FD73EA|nr:STAS domain-containing protein [Aliamphritea hakodatensis]
MAPFSCKPHAPDTLVLSGDLIFATAEHARQVTEARLAERTGRVVMDFSEISRVDSSALAFWLSCQRLAERNDLSLEALHFPDEMVQMAELVGLSSSRIWK